ncbi:unnamed protein product [Acanthoscelides obtectus]|uniref:Uncharacterized protein n=1 Tax=Acanthoscelides obtectus TaxID=200917 RepID=A0A9P0KW92_ACAOB|nr:unnamed protein product [Acanthoscelides obtectus]CAK1635059.1 Zinc finger MYM-type protein 6 [Acanthoscelides obtectus]
MITQIIHNNKKATQNIMGQHLTKLATLTSILMLVAYTSSPKADMYTCAKRLREKQETEFWRESKGSVFSNHPTPRFISRGSTFKVVTGDTVVLPCEIQNLGKLSFKKNNQQDSVIRLVHLPSLLFLHTRWGSFRADIDSKLGAVPYRLGRGSDIEAAVESLSRDLTAAYEENCPLRKVQAESLQRMRLDKSGSYHTGVSQQLKASFEIAKQKKPHIIGEELIKPYFLKATQIILGEDAEQKVKSISLSNNTVKRRIDVIGADIKSQVRNKFIMLQVSNQSIRKPLQILHETYITVYIAPHQCMNVRERERRRERERERESERSSERAWFQAYQAVLEISQFLNKIHSVFFTTKIQEMGNGQGFLCIMQENNKYSSTTTRLHCIELKAYEHIQI